MLDRVAAEKVGLPVATLHKWKHAPEGDWRYAFYLSITTSRAVRKEMTANLKVRREGENLIKHNALMEKRRLKAQA